ncbi:autotransporter-associated beta strand repeat-containing protein, partial [Martelella limonii]|uniref:autotransporter-associated beta strand repeat-containing protein n=1 Tax=Martelella limonii TaxID=1647649 RepID=UPI0019D6824D
MAQLAAMGVIALTSLSAGHASALDLYWNPDGTIGTGVPIVGGAGTWSTSSTFANWTNLANTAAGQAWPIGGAIAHLGGNFTAEASLLHTEITIDGTIDFDSIFFFDDFSGTTTVDSPYVLRGGALRLAPANGTTSTIYVYPGLSNNSAPIGIYSDIVANGAATNLDVTGPGWLVLNGHVGLGSGVLHIASADGVSLGSIESQGNYRQLGDYQASIDPDTIIELAPALDGNGVQQPGTVIFAAPLGDYQLRNVIRSTSTNAADSRVGLFNNGAYIYGSPPATITTTYLLSDNPDMHGTTELYAGYLDGTGSVAGPVLIGYQAELHGTQGSTSLGLGTSLTLSPALIFSGITVYSASVMAFNVNAANADLAMFTTGDLNIKDGLLTVTVDNQNAGIYNLGAYSGTFTGNGALLFSAAATINGLAAGQHYILENTAPIVGGEKGMLRLIVLDSATDEVDSYWNGGGAKGNFVGGTGTWDSSTMNWASDTTAAQEFAWSNSVGIFDGTGGAVTISGVQRFDRLAFNVDGYTLSAAAGSGLKMSPYSATTASITVAAGSTTIAADILDGTNQAGAQVNALAIDGPGTLVLSGSKSFTGLTSVQSGTLQLGDQTAAAGLSGALEVLSGATLAGVANGGNAPQTIVGLTTLDQGANLVVTLSLMPGNAALFDVSTAGLDISGGIVNVTVANLGSLSAGRYNLFDYGSPSMLVGAVT